MSVTYSNTEGNVQVLQTDVYQNDFTLSDVVTYRWYIHENYLDCSVIAKQKSDIYYTSSINGGHQSLNVGEQSPWINQSRSAIYVIAK